MSETRRSRQVEGETAALPVYVRLLGAPSVTLGNETLKFRYRKAEALLYILAFERRRMPRHRIAQLLWPGADARNATRNLRVILTDLRAKIGDRLVTPNDSPHVFLQRVRSDLDRIESLATLPLEALASEALLTESATLLDGFHVEESSEFEEWRRHADDQVQERLAGERAKQLEQAHAADASHATFALLDVSVQRDPWDTTQLMRFVRLALRRGDVTLALRRVRGALDVIRGELDVEPSPDVRGLVHALTTRRTASPLQPSPLVGHLTMQEDIETWALHGTERVLGLVGAPGLGTSSLARTALLTNPILQGVTVQPIDVHDCDADTVVRRMREVFTAHASTVASPIILLDGLAHAEDVRHATRTALIDEMPMRWVYTTLQPLDVPGERVLAIEPLRVPSAMQLRLHRDVPSMDLFLRTAREEDPDRTFQTVEEANLTRLLRRTGGHPLAIIALAKVAVATPDASAIDLHDVWTSGVTEALALKASMTTLLAELPREARRTVTCLALFESGAHVSELSACMQEAVGRVEVILHQLHRLGWVVEDVTTRRILHRVAPWAVAALHADVATLHDAPEVMTRFAACIQSRVAPLAQELQGSRQREAVQEGLVMLGDVLTATDLLASDDPPAALALAAAAWPLFRRAGRAAELLARIEPLTREHADHLEDSERADALATLANLMILVGRMGDARPLHEEALTLRDARGDLRARAQSRLNLARVLAMLGDLEASSTMLHEGAELAQDADEIWLYAACLGNRGHVLRELGRLEEASRVYEVALGVLESIDDTLSIVGLRIALLGVMVHLGQAERVVRNIHMLEPRMQAVPFGSARSLSRPVRVAIDELANAGWWHAAELLERAAYDNGFLVE